MVKDLVFLGPQPHDCTGKLRLLAPGDCLPLGQGARLWGGSQDREVQEELLSVQDRCSLPNEGLEMNTHEPISAGRSHTAFPPVVCLRL